MGLGLAAFGLAYFLGLGFSTGAASSSPKRSMSSSFFAGAGLVAVGACLAAHPWISAGEKTLTKWYQKWMLG